MNLPWKCPGSKLLLSPPSVPPPHSPPSRNPPQRGLCNGGKGEERQKEEKKGADVRTTTTLLGRSQGARAARQRRHRRLMAMSTNSLSYFVSSWLRSGKIERSSSSPWKELGYCLAFDAGPVKARMAVEIIQHRFQLERLSAVILHM
jgi:hypothetical protein